MEEEIYPPNDRKLLEWLASLSAAGLDYRLSRHGSEWVIHIPAGQHKAALDEIRAYEEANSNWPPGKDAGISPPEPCRDTWAAAWGALFPAWFYAWLGPYDSANAITAAGASSAAGMASGEWWRAVTALTLHSDLAHLAGNVLSIFLFSHAICKALGGGLGWLLILASGVAGNIAAAGLASSLQVSVGASTASFGALGIISAYRSIRFLRSSGQWQSIWSRAWIPIGAGLALLGMLGTGRGADLMAHLFGFLFGILIAAPFAWQGAHGLPEWCQRALQLFCIMVVMLCWRAAAAAI